MSQNAALIQDYAKSILMQYVSKPKAYAHIEAYVTALMIYDLAIAVRDGYDPATVTGVQCDIIGKYLGLLREIKGFALQNSGFGLLDYTQTPPIEGVSAFLDYAAEPSGHFLDYADGDTTYILTDAEFHIVIAMAIQRQHGNGSMENIHNTLYPVFGNDYLVVETQMGLHYFIQAVHQRMAGLLDALGFFPRPMGVKSTVVVKTVLSS